MSPPLLHQDTQSLAEQGMLSTGQDISIPAALWDKDELPRTNLFWPSPKPPSSISWPVAGWCSALAISPCTAQPLVTGKGVILPWTHHHPARPPSTASDGNARAVSSLSSCTAHQVPAATAYAEGSFGLGHPKPCRSPCPRDTSRARCWCCTHKAHGACSSSDQMQNQLLFSQGFMINPKRGGEQGGTQACVGLCMFPRPEIRALPRSHGRHTQLFDSSILSLLLPGVFSACQHRSINIEPSSPSP